MDSSEVYLERAEKLSNDLNYIKGKANVYYLKGIQENIKSNYALSLDFFKTALKHYKSIQNKKGIANIHTAFGITHYDQSQYEKAIDAYQKAKEIYTDLGDKRELATILINTANAYSEIGNFDESIINYKNALKHSRAIHDEDGVAFVNLNLGALYTKQGNYPLAIDNYNKALDYHQKLGNTLSTAKTLGSLGRIYNSLKKYDKAIAYYQQSIDVAPKGQSKQRTAVNNGNLGDIYASKKAYSKALEHYQKSLEISQEINDLKQAAISLVNIGKIHLELNKPIIARNSFIEVRDISQQTNNKDIYCTSLLAIAQTYLYDKQYKKALSLIEKGQRIAKELELLGNQKKAHELLYVVYKNTGQFKKALENYEQFKVMSDSIFNKESIEKITQIEYEYKYKTQLESAEKRELKLTKTVLETSKDLEKSKRNYLWAVIGFLLVTIISSSVIFYQKLRNAKAKTQNVIVEQKLLRSQMTPHFIFNSLSVLQGMILNKEEKKSISYLSKFSKLLYIVLENSRDKTVLLSQELKAVKNYLALQSLENENFEYTVSITDTIDENLFKIPPMLIQPFVENAIEHAFANRQKNRIIAIRLTFRNKKLICTVIDNGIGIDALKKNKNHDKNSLSTTITSERLKMLSKDFKMKSSVTVEDRKKYNEQGTLVTLIIPYIIHNV
ncbi:tetratricopeptide repeat-containing sensor histidine kinase [Hyunsoonleella ulvae]|uniref:tetratricopeptide repeat-containing sensor histidine kinase n=1 Tax=Hyunsoonleella ulvae TaxID=2799948 RepID=UPI00193AB54D|nr:tetratricopeptide repeat protein [Hyunsoonleella ulvae]